MGIKDRLLAAKRYLWSPLTISMLERGSDRVAKAGHTARVVVDVEGEDDGTTERIGLRLRLNDAISWPLGDVPTSVGRHELEVTVPPDAPPSSLWTTYYWVGKPHRSHGMAVDALSPVRIIGHPDHVAWPDGPRSGSDGLTLSLDGRAVDAGGSVSGRAPGAESVEVGYVLDAPQDGEQQQRFTTVADARPGPDGAFTLPIAASAPPTLHNGDSTWVYWEVRATAGAASAWQRFALLDPDGQAELVELKSSLSDLLT